VALVSALVCTRNRPEDIGKAVRSLLASAEDEIELIVIDQSDDGRTEAALAAFASDRRLCYVRSSSRGKGAALNEGLRRSRGEILVCTDDDCEAPAHWVVAMGRTLEQQPTAAVVFCNVVAPPHDRSAGYVPAYERQHSRLLRSIAATVGGHGLGAGMALRRQVILDLGGFDEALGPGARFPSGDDWDITARALLRGWHVYETAELGIVHHGFRTLEQGRKHARRDWIAIGAVCAKPLRAGHWNAVVVPLWEFSAHAIWPPLADAFRLRRPRGVARIAGFIEGFAAGLLTPVDRKTLLFEPRR
jgi:glycosyltransferase involved in cell wall biosynthesis